MCANFRNILFCQFSKSSIENIQTLVPIVKCKHLKLYLNINYLPQNILQTQLNNFTVQNTFVENLSIYCYNVLNSATNKFIEKLLNQSFINLKKFNLIVDEPEYVGARRLFQE